MQKMHARMKTMMKTMMMGIGMVAIVFVAIVLLVNVKECVDDDVEAQECSNAATVAAKFAKCPPPSRDSYNL